MIEMVKTRKQQLEERIKQLEGYVYEGDDTPDLRRYMRIILSF